MVAITSVSTKISLFLGPDIRVDFLSPWYQKALNLIGYPVVPKWIIILIPSAKCLEEGHLLCGERGPY